LRALSFTIYSFSIVSYARIRNLTAAVLAPQLLHFPRVVCLGLDITASPLLVYHTLLQKLMTMLIKFVHSSYVLVSPARIDALVQQVCDQCAAPGDVFIVSCYLPFFDTLVRAGYLPPFRVRAAFFAALCVGVNVSSSESWVSLCCNCSLQSYFRNQTPSFSGRTSHTHLSRSLLTFFRQTILCALCSHAHFSCSILTLCER
jgi:hypothetical protein